MQEGRKAYIICEKQLLVLLLACLVLLCMTIISLLVMFFFPSFFFLFSFFFFFTFAYGEVRKSYKYLHSYHKCFIIFMYKVKVLIPYTCCNILSELLYTIHILCRTIIKLPNELIHFPFPKIFSLFI